MSAPDAPLAVGLNGPVSLQPRQCGDDLADALRSLADTMAFDSADYGAVHRQSWMYGIVNGWECELAHDHNDVCEGSAALAEQAVKWGWEPETVARLRRYHAAVKTLLDKRDAEVSAKTG